MKNSKLKSFVTGLFFVVGTFVSGYLMLYAAINVKVALNDQMNTYANPVHPLASAWSTFGHVKNPFVHIGWVGDIAPANKENEKDPSLLFTHVKDLLDAPDIMIGNLEGTLSENGSPKCDNTKPNCYTFAGSNALATSLKDAGFDVLNLANNHSYDFGPSGFEETKKILESLSIVPTGGRHDIRYIYWNGKTIAFVGASSYYWTPSFLDMNEFIAHIKEAKEKADVVVVLFHGGGEGAGYAHTPDKEEWYIGENRGDLRMMARRAIDEGASVVIGSGPHVLRGIEFYKEHLISITKKGMHGQEEISAMMEVYRNNPPQNINGVAVAQLLDYEKQIGKNLVTGETWVVDLPKSNVLQFVTEDGSKISARPSGTEPKIKFYFSVKTELKNKEEFDVKFAELEKKIEGIRDESPINSFINSMGPTLAQILPGLLLNGNNKPQPAPINGPDAVSMSLDRISKIVPDMDIEELLEKLADYAETNPEQFRNLWKSWQTMPKRTLNNSET